MGDRLGDEASAEALPRKRTSGWSIASLICAIGIGCPLLALLAPLLGLKAIAHIRGTPGVGGLRLAAAGMALGLLGICLWIAVAVWWNEEGRQRMLRGPSEELAAGLAGDVAGFKSGFTEPGARLPDERAQQFLNEISSRYGWLKDIRQDVYRTDPEPGRLSDVIPYVLEFEGQLVQAEAKLVLFADGVSPRWEYIVLLDDEQGDISYPPGQQRLPAPTSAE